MVLVLTVAGFVFLGMIRDFHRSQFKVLLPYQILLIIFGGYFEIIVYHDVRALSVIFTIIWPLMIVYCLKLASLVFEMPFLLCLGSGVTFLLFFPSQQTTPPWAEIFTLGLIVVSVFVLLFQLKDKRGFLGDSGLFALGYLLAAISMLGRSKTILVLSLLVPSMVIIYPFVLTCFLIMYSYLGNRLYLSDPKERKFLYRWTLSRGWLIFFSTTVFVCLNLLALFIRVQVSWYGYFALGLIFVVAIAAFVRTFARKYAEILPTIGSRISILEIPIDVVDSKNVIERVKQFLAEPQGLFHIITADSLAVFRAYREKSFKRIFQRASLILPDGAGLIWAADFLGTPLPSRVPGIALVDDLTGFAAENGSSIYFLGSKPGIAQKAALIMKEKHPKLVISGYHHGVFHEGSVIEDEVLEEISKKKPDVLFVALGVPKQESFIQKLRPMASGIVAIGVGGSFDVVSGNIPRAPEIMQRFALEWLFRLWKEPRRFSRILRIPRFVLAVIRAKWQEKDFML